MTRQKVAVVTGASSGIGYATALEFAKRGYKVYACARRLAPMEPLKDHGIITVSCDVTSDDSVQSLFKVVDADNDGVNVLFNNAGQPLGLAALDLDDVDVKRCFDVNVFAPIKLTKIFAPLLIKASGTVGFTGSLAVISPLPFTSVYAATKAALHSYVKTLRLELQPLGVTVINIVTGMVETNIGDDREFPQDSLYRVSGYEEFMEAKKDFMKSRKPTPAAVYAQRVVSDFESAKLGGKYEFYRGKFASIVSFIAAWFPESVLSNQALEGYKLGKMFSSLRDQYLKK